MIARKRPLKNIEYAFETHDAVGLLGPRQCGKIPLAEFYRKQHPSLKKF